MPTEPPKVIQKLLRHGNLKVTMDTYFQAVSDEKRKAQRRLWRCFFQILVGQWLLNGLFWTRGKMMGTEKSFRMLASRTGVEPVSPP